MENLVMIQFHRNKKNAFLARGITGVPSQDGAARGSTWHHWRAEPGRGSTWHHWRAEPGRGSTGSRMSQDVASLACRARTGQHGEQDEWGCVGVNRPIRPIKLTLHHKTQGTGFLSPSIMHTGSASVHVRTLAIPSLSTKAATYGATRFIGGATSFIEGATCFIVDTTWSIEGATRSNKWRHTLHRGRHILYKGRHMLIVVSTRSKVPHFFIEGATCFIKCATAL